jgi:hypothetical protein
MLLYLFFHVFFFNYFYKQLCATCVLFNKIKWNVKKPTSLKAPHGLKIKFVCYSKMSIKNNLIIIQGEFV